MKKKGKKKKEDEEILFADCLVGGGYCAGWFMCMVFHSEKNPGRNMTLVLISKMRKTASHKPQITYSRSYC